HASKRPTALYGDPGVNYHGPLREDADLPAFGYASNDVNAWTPELLELKAKAEEWHLEHTGLKVVFSACLMNRYDGGDEWLGWHSDREELDPALNAPRASPIASISLGATRRFGFRLKMVPGKEGECETARLGHGSLCIMENVCQLLYQHSLLPEPAWSKKGKGVRVNLTFRSSNPTLPAEKALALTSAMPSAATGESESLPAVGGAQREPLFVGLTPNVSHTTKGYKKELFHPFETPFTSDKADLASLRYRTWLLAQPLFHSWVCSELRGRELQGGSERKKRAKDFAHVRGLAAITGALCQPEEQVDTAEAKALDFKVLQQRAEEAKKRTAAADKSGKQGKKAIGQVASPQVSIGKTGNNREKFKLRNMQGREANNNGREVPQGTQAVADSRNSKRRLEEAVKQPSTPAETGEPKKNLGKKQRELAKKRKQLAS
ncbi:unnamed protein product, partial [Polarella glacialis]